LTTLYIEGCVAKVNKSQAAKMARVSRPTIDKKIKSGELSAEKQYDGSVLIDVSELERVFGSLVAPDTMQPARKDLHADTSQVAAILQSQIELLQREIYTLREEREKDRREREQLLEIIQSQTRLLPAPKEPEPKKTFWQRLFG
jgi:hypothetical protein